MALCGSGVGASIAANKVPGVRAAICHDVYSAGQGVADDDLNVLCLGGRVVGPALAEELVRTFLGARFSKAPRHLRRLQKVTAMEQETTRVVAQNRRIEPCLGDSIGVDLGGTALRSGLVRRDGTIENFSRIEHGALSPGEAVGRIVDALARLQSSGPVGLGVAGVLEDGVVRNAPNLGWRDVPLRATLESRLNREITMVNDMCAIAWAEAAARSEDQDVLCLFLGTGLGSAIAGSNGTRDLELGHVIDEIDGLPCGCGRRGCLEAYVGGGHIPFRMSRAAAQDVTPASIDAAAQRKEGEAIALWEDISDRLARAAAAAASSLRPSCLVLGGGVLDHAPLLRSWIEANLEARLSTLAAASLRIESPRLGDRSGVLGAALLAALPTQSRRRVLA